MSVNHEGGTARTSAHVTLEAGGSHQFDLGHLSRQGAERLVRALLGAAGYRQPTLWRVRVEKKITCNAETKAVALVGFKPWCCYLKIKPGDNNTAHFCSLLMPAGHRGEVVHDSLKAAEELINRAWRRGFKGEVLPVDESARADQPGVGREAAPPTPETAGHANAPEGTLAPEGPRPDGAAPEPATPTVAGEEEGGEAGAGELVGWTDDPDRVRLTLLAVHELVREGQVTGVDVFVASLAAKLGWQGARRRQIGGILTGLVRRGHIQKLSRGSLPLGYALTEQGQRFIRELLPAGAAAPPAAPASPGDPAQLVAALAEVAQGYTVAYQKLRANRARRAELLAEVERLDAEARELSRVVDDPEVQALLERVVRRSHFGKAGPEGGEIAAGRGAPATTGTPPAPRG